MYADCVVADKVHCPQGASRDIIFVCIWSMVYFVIYGISNEPESSRESSVLYAVISQSTYIQSAWVKTY